MLYNDDYWFCSDKEDLLAVYQNNNTEGQPLMDYFSSLKHDPMNVFYSSNTAIGLYARQKWLHQEDTLAWKNDFRETVDLLYAGQLPNGSWDDSLLTTAQRLFGLHLTVRNINERIGNALE